MNTLDIPLFAVLRKRKSECPAGGPFNDGRRDEPPGIAASVAVFDQGQQQMQSGLGQLRRVLGQGGEADVGQGGVFDIVKPQNGELVWNGDAPLVRHLDKAEGHRVGSGEDGGLRKGLGKNCRARWQPLSMEEEKGFKRVSTLMPSSSAAERKPWWRRACVVLFSRRPR